jgi:hypothetical protein
VHTAHSRYQVTKATTERTATTTADVRDRLARLGAPQMPDHLAAKVADAIAAESARRGFVTAR